MGVSPAGRGPNHHYSYATRLKTTPLHVSLKALMQLDVRQCLILYVSQLMQLDLKQVDSVTLLVSHSLLMPSCHFVYMQTYANPYSLSDLGVKVW